ncbi:uncharacterized protein LOC120497316 isoform X1 [Passer montanus]|uniref:uncharacterized protein LOC120497316 isoform X1 n=1 Tax=Passer montanus TaxID=9160 RepID=UPI0019618FFF|nr:uncharacterized protein LOC120497316 isoform X1 [Passer montanus]
MELRGTGRKRPGFKAAQHSFTRHKNVPGEPRNPRLVWVGRDLKDHLIPTPCHGQGHLPLSQAAPSPSVQPGLGHCQGCRAAPASPGRQSSAREELQAEPTLLGERVPQETAPASTAKSRGGRIRNVQRHFGFSYTIPTGGLLQFLIPQNSVSGRHLQGGHAWDQPMDAAGKDPRRFFHGISPWMQLEGTQGGHSMGSPHGCSWKGPKEGIPWDHPINEDGRDPRRAFHGITPWMQLEGTQGAPKGQVGLQSWAGTPFTQPFTQSQDHQGWKSPPRPPSPTCARPHLGTQPRALSATSSPQTQNWEFDLLTQLWLHPFCFLRSFLQPTSCTGTCVGYVGMEEGHIPGIQHF